MANDSWSDEDRDQALELAARVCNDGDFDMGPIAQAIREFAAWDRARYAETLRAEYARGFEAASTLLESSAAVQELARLRKVAMYAGRLSRHLKEVGLTCPGCINARRDLRKALAELDGGK